MNDLHLPRVSEKVRPLHRLRWDISNEDAEIVKMIVDRAMHIISEALLPKAVADLVYMDLTMDLIATHMNGTPLDLQRLLEADDFSFMHDVGGIRRHLNRITAQLDNQFVPRFAL